VTFAEVVGSIAGIGGGAAGLASFILTVRKARKRHDDTLCAQAKRTLENFHDGILLVNREGVIIYANKQARFITGYSTELVGRDFRILIPPDLRGQHEGHFQRFWSNPHTRKMGAGMELTLIDRLGNRLRVDLSLTPQEDEFGGSEAAVGIRVIT
jgi:PAS domain S-box-containing protein